MEFLKEADFRREIKNTPRAGYLFFGEEDYLKAIALQGAREAISPDEALSFFNEMRIDALDFTPQKLLDALMPMPMMSDRKLITVTGLNFNSMKPNDVEELCAILALLPEYDYNTVIITLSDGAINEGFLPKRPSPFLTKLSEFLTLVWFERTATAKLTAWIGRHFAHNGIEASPALCAGMAEYCGHSMMTLAKEIDKLSFYLLSHKKTVADEESMRKVCIPTAEYDAFAFTNAIMEGRQDAALAILADYKLRRVEPLIILGDVIRVICDMIAVRAMSEEGTPQKNIGTVLKLHEYKVGLYQKSLRNTPRERLRAALEACNAADAALKLSPQGYSALEQLVCSI